MWFGYKTDGSVLRVDSRSRANDSQQIRFSLVAELL